MTFGLNNATSGLSSGTASAIAGVSGTQRSERNSSGAGAPSFAQMLQQHQSAAPAPQPQKAPEQQAARTNDQSAARLAERQAAERNANARQTEANQQASRDAAARAEQSAADRKARPEPADGATTEPAAEMTPQAAGAKSAAKTPEAERGRKSGSTDKPDAATDKKATSADIDQKDDATKAASAQDPAATATPTPTSATARPVPLDAAALAAQAAAAASAENKPEAVDASSKPRVDIVANTGGEAATAGEKLAATAKEHATAKAGDATSADAATAAAGAKPEGGFAAAMQAASGEHKPGGDSSRNPGGEQPAAARVDAAAGSMNIASLIGASNVAGVAAPTPDSPPAAATQLPFSTPIDSPDFTRSLGVQVSTLAADGIQHAQLHMNPAETGPIAIQITLDGTQARVDFQATNAATRDAISAGMPELAAALHSAGLTLAGGGVSEHGRGRSEAQDSQRQPGFGQRGVSGVDGGTSAAPPTVARQPRGAVDLYA